MLLLSYTIVITSSESTVGANKRLNMDLEILENKLNIISAKIQIIDSLARVTLDAVRYGDNLKEIDKECLLIILNNRIKDLDIKMRKAIDQFY